MALSQAASVAKSKLDAELGQSNQGINIKLGPGLFAEFDQNGLLPKMWFEAIGLGEMFEHTSYAECFAFCGRELSLYDFKLGDGGHVP